MVWLGENRTNVNVIAWAQLRDLLVYNTAFDGQQRVIESDKIVRAVLFQIHYIEIKLDDVVGICPKMPLHEGVGGIGLVGEARRHNLPNAIGPHMLSKL